MEAAGFGVQLLHGEPYHLIEPVTTMDLPLLPLDEESRSQFELSTNIPST
jgi:hypothetical protein